MNDIRYCAFLKFKKNEVYALNDLTDNLKRKINVFFDMPNELPSKSRARKKDDFSHQELIYSMNQSFLKKVEAQKKYLDSKLTWLDEFYFDNYDIDPLVSVDNKTYNYQTIIDNFAPFGMIPVCGVDDRSPAHLDSILNSKRVGKFKTDKVAVRIVESVFEDYEYIEDEFIELINILRSCFTKIVIIFDLRCIYDEKLTVTKLIDFLDKLDLSAFHEIIISGSTIPKSIKTLLGTNQIKNFDRKEVFIFKKILEKKITFSIGDYTCVSPETN